MIATTAQGLEGAGFFEAEARPARPSETGGRAANADGSLWNTHRSRKNVQQLEAATRHLPPNCTNFITYY